MRVVFAGTPEFARAALAQLLAAGFDIALVLTQPDRPAGRGMKLQASAVKEFAQTHGLPLMQPPSLRLDGKYPQEVADVRDALLAAQADVMVVAAYGLILPLWVLEIPRLGCFNIHASLLPRWRGAAPIHRAIEAGDAETGVTIMQMDAGLDTGDMLLKEALPIGPEDTTGSLHDKLAALGARMIVGALDLAARGGLQPVPQPAQGVSYARKIEKQEAVIDWTVSAHVIERRIRAFNPFPGASTGLGTELIKVWRAAAVGDGDANPARPGTVLAVGDDGIVVRCGQGALRLTELQRQGGKRLSPADFLRGFALTAGSVLGD